MLSEKGELSGICTGTLWEENETVELGEDRYTSPLFVGGAVAQDPPPLLQTIIFDVKDDKINDFVDASA